MNTEVMINVSHSIWHELMGLAPAHEDGKKTFHVEPSTMSIHITGYSPEEVGELLAAYRDHQEKMIGIVARMNEANRAMQSEADAVRYVPQGPEDIMGEDMRG